MFNQLVICSFVFGSREPQGSLGGGGWGAAYEQTKENDLLFLFGGKLIFCFSLNMMLRVSLTSVGECVDRSGWIWLFKTPLGNTDQ